MGDGMHWRAAYKILAGKSEGKRQFGRNRDHGRITLNLTLEDVYEGLKM
jgi:hypothetical protein